MWNKAATISTICMLALAIIQAEADSIPQQEKRSPLEWHVGAEVSPAYVIGTNAFLRGYNPSERHINASFAGAARAGLSFNPESRLGQLYRGLYQGIGLQAHTFSTGGVLGTPVSVFVYQGAPIVHFNSRLSLGYEWKFGAAFGWHHYHYDYASGDEWTAPVSTAVTAHMELGLKFDYKLTDRWHMTFGVDAVHFSNGNTSIPNAGVNSVGASVGFYYVINPQPESGGCDVELAEEADKPRWFYDIVAYGAWRKRIVTIDDEQNLCSGKFGVVGLQFAPMRSLNRYVAVGPSLDMQWDESAGLAPYRVDGSYGENIRFYRPPFSKQISVGLSARAELTMPIFSINAGLGYDIINPKGDRRFYQSLSVKTFVSKKLFLNVGYRIGAFKDPQNLMLGFGVRL